ncbi:N-acetylglucosaminyl deacetylase, LmbE family [Filimonas lacunae]|uniref:N-acetylglucosaminyl deacetylase, LmbE family n=1 Tax=Filimonas lacunae TaxID=477680 RepID=A0A173MLP3_9BACT|nr:PIG-L family deacetylase [Filimonas lacunae]BAV08544.1 hypothetical protein FLA_4590 [Filimonas lacunae]SIS56736.1 N-acetylglucosaminyl deacetylase, LmbE family [Filimonas lacunae]
MNKLTSGLLGVWIGGMIAATAQAQAPVATNSTDIYRKMQKLEVLGTVLYFAAHPDDENTKLLAYLAKEKQYKTGYLSLTRGDGGQNLIGNEQGVELGLIRTQELLAARRIDGAEQMFSSAYDFGFSKNSEEALSIWNHDKILSDAVWIIRYYQPDVIITRFPGDARAGHGHHAASAILANEAFTAAADSTRFPEQLKNGLTIWQAKRILWNTFNFGGNNTTSEDQLKIDVGVYNPMLGEGYGEIASESRSQHKSQGFGVAKQRGQSFEYFTTTGGKAPSKELLDEVNTTWSRIKGGEKILPQVTKLVKEYSFERPENSINQLIALHKTISALPATTPYRKQKLDEVEKLIVDCSGLFAEAVTGTGYAVKGQPLKITITANKRNEIPVVLKQVSLNNEWDTVLNSSLAKNLNFSFPYTLQVPVTESVSQPYWLAKPMNKGSFEIGNQQNLAQPENAPAYSAVFTIQIKDLEIKVARPLRYKFTDAVKGEIYEPVTVIEPITVSVAPAATLLNVQPGNEKTAQPVVEVQFKSYVTAEKLPVKIQLLQQDKVLYSKDSAISVAAGNTYTIPVALKDVSEYQQVSGIHAAIVVVQQGKTYTYTQYLRHIAYDHIPDVNYFSESTMKVVSPEIKTVGKKIGYIPGAGDKVPPALEQMGYAVTLLNEADITPANLKQFDAVITGIRAYNVNDFLEYKYATLMQYIQEGGNLIVQYCTNTGIGPVKAKMAPYPLQITNKRVTDENAAVKILLPQHPALNYPNKITAADFEGWIQERSIYHADQLDVHYETLFAMADKNEPETNGSLVIAPYGKGNFVYTGIVFFRELPAAVPGAFRLMANLIALPKH